MCMQSAASSATIGAKQAKQTFGNEPPALMKLTHLLILAVRYLVKDATTSFD